MLSGAPASEKTSIFTRGSARTKSTSDWSIYSRDFTRVYLDMNNNTALLYLKDNSSAFLYIDQPRSTVVSNTCTFSFDSAVSQNEKIRFK